MMSIKVERDSVCAGDDGDAPHTQTFELNDGTTLEDTLKHIIGSRYLASIQGGKATWIVHGKMPLAVVAQQWLEPKFLVDPLQEIPDRELFFEYCQQKDPDEVYEKSLLRS